MAAAARRAEGSPIRTAGVATSTRRTTAIDVVAAGRSITAQISAGTKDSKAVNITTRVVAITHPSAAEVQISKIFLTARGRTEARSGTAIAIALRLRQIL